MVCNHFTAGKVFGMIFTFTARTDSFGRRGSFVGISVAQRDTMTSQLVNENFSKGDKEKEVSRAMASFERRTCKNFGTAPSDPSRRHFVKRDICAAEKHACTHARANYH